MKRKQPVKLTSGEVDLMDLLWRHQKLTLAAAHAAFDAGRIGYTTMQTRLNRLVEKGLARRSSDRPAVYSPCVAREEVQAGHLDDMLSDWPTEVSFPWWHIWCVIEKSIAMNFPN